MNSDSGRREWIEIAVEVDPVAHEATGAFLFDVGCEGLVMPESPGDPLVAYFPLSAACEEMLERIHLFLQGLPEIFPGISSPGMHSAKIKDQNWELGWRRFFRPDRVTPNLLILPVWESLDQTSEKSFNGVVIKMDPGPAFGTGRHATTRMCLKGLETVLPPRPWSMLDVGTGSGILAIYAALLGAARVVAIDTDPEAVRWAFRNIEINRVSGVVRPSTTPIGHVKDGYTVITANLIFETIVELMPDFVRLLGPGGSLILSGLLDSQVKRIEKSIGEHGLLLKDLMSDGDWTCLICEMAGREKAGDL